jgi:hypothetical protein
MKMFRVRFLLWQFAFGPSTIDETQFSRAPVGCPQTDAA